MREEPIITNLADTFGLLLEDIVSFIFSISAGWIVLLSVLTGSSIIIIYTRFFARKGVRQ